LDPPPLEKPLENAGRKLVPTSKSSVVDDDEFFEIQVTTDLDGTSPAEMLPPGPLSSEIMQRSSPLPKKQRRLSTIAAAAAAAVSPKLSVSAEEAHPAETINLWELMDGLEEDLLQGPPAAALGELQNSSSRSNSTRSSPPKFKHFHKNISSSTVRAIRTVDDLAFAKAARSRRRVKPVESPSSPDFQEMTLDTPAAKDQNGMKPLASSAEGCSTWKLKPSDPGGSFSPKTESAGSSRQQDNTAGLTLSEQPMISSRLQRLEEKIITATQQQEFRKIMQSSSKQYYPSLKTDQKSKQDEDGEEHDSSQFHQSPAPRGVVVSEAAQGLNQERGKISRQTPAQRQEEHCTPAITPVSPKAPRKASKAAAAKAPGVGKPPRYPSKPKSSAKDDATTGLHKSSFKASVYPTVEHHVFEEKDASEESLRTKDSTALPTAAKDSSDDDGSEKESSTTTPEELWAEELESTFENAELLASFELELERFLNDEWWYKMRRGHDDDGEPETLEVSIPGSRAHDDENLAKDRRSSSIASLLLASDTNVKGNKIIEIGGGGVKIPVYNSA
jgi:alkylhydroperoxidase/carboxymuconolactone decarboxylase family protein YurZ